MKLSPLLFGMLLFAASPSVAQSTAHNEVSVTATEEVTLEATIAAISLGVEGDDASAGGASRKVAQQSASVVTWLKSQKITKLQTTGVSLQPQYRYDRGRSEVTGYRASNQISFNIELSDAGGVLDSAVEKGATQISSVNFLATDEAMTAAKLSAIEKATLSAKTQGERSLQALGLSSAGVSGISVNSRDAAPPRPMMARSMEMQAAAGSTTPIEGGQLAVSASVTLRLRF